jgi:hypothetical protein
MTGFLIPSLEQYRYLRQCKRRRRLQDGSAITQREVNPLSHQSGLYSATASRRQSRSLSALQGCAESVADTGHGKTTSPRSIGAGNLEKPSKPIAIGTRKEGRDHRNGEVACASVQTDAATASQVSVFETNPGFFDEAAKTSQNSILNPSSQAQAATNKERHPSPPPGNIVQKRGSHSSKHIKTLASEHENTNEALTQSSTVSSSATEVLEIGGNILLAASTKVANKKDRQHDDCDAAVKMQLPQKSSQGTDNTSVTDISDNQQQFYSTRSANGGHYPSSIVTSPVAESEGSVSPIQSPVQELRKHQQQQKQDADLKQCQLPFKQQSSTSATATSLTSTNSKPWFQKRKRKRMSQTRLCFSNK